MRKMTHALWVVGLVGVSALGTISAAQADVTGNMAFVSDYIFRGLTQSWSKPVVQAGLDYTHSSGLYLGTWGSGVSDKEYSNASMEWDIYGGYNGKINDDLSWGVGAIEVWYPGGHANNTEKTKYNTQELNAQINYKILNVKYSYALTNLFGLDKANPFNQAVSGDTKGSSYLEANINYELMDKLTLGFHVGHQKVKNASIYSYSDYKISLNKELPKEFFGLNVGLAYSDTNAPNNVWSFSGATNKDVAASAWILSVGKTF